jgi:hypothetical protein
MISDIHGLQPRIPDAMFDDIFEQAVLDLISHNEVIHGIDQE